jgi:F-type H+-transporting ATPase subunit b
VLIDWFTVGAQALNFLILVWVLKRFLYKPMLEAIAAREQRIAAELADAAGKRTEAERERDDLQTKNKAFDEQRSQLLGKATGEANAERERLLAEARKAAEILATQQRTALQNDRAALGRELARLASEEVFGIARKALADLATASLEERLGAVFTRRLREMDDKAKGELALAIKASSEPALLRSAFELPAEQRATIQNALNECFSAAVQVRFETAPGTLCGIELSVSGQKRAWSIAGYLTSLEEKVGALLDSQSPPVPVAGAQVEAP